MSFFWGTFLWLLGLGALLLAGSAVAAVVKREREKVKVITGYIGLLAVLGMTFYLAALAWIIAPIRGCFS